MNTSVALIPRLLTKTSSSYLGQVLAVISGSLLLAILAQISVPLPWTPVPITGQTFGVSLLALLWGRKHAMAAFALYLGEAAIGLPVLAMGKAYLTAGPTIGYLGGMFLACALVGHLADKGYAKTPLKAFLCCELGSLCVFAIGLAGLSFFVPGELLLAQGLWPFVPGDILKNLLASFTVSKIQSKF